MIRDRLFGLEHAFDHPVTVWITVGIGGLIVLGLLVIGILGATGRVSPSLRSELWKRTLSWAVIAPLVVGPILLGAAWTIGAILVLSLLCFNEYARATGLFREKLTTAVAGFGILCVFFAVVDHWYGFFVALIPLGFALIATTAILLDRPKGYIQRVALGVLGFMFFGCALGHLAYMANDFHYRPILLTVIVAVQMNDVFAYIVGKSFGRSRLAPNTSPNKTVAGAIGALALTTTVFALLAHSVFRGTPVDKLGWLILLGAIVSATGQLGDLALSSIKRDLGIKDMGSFIPGHGGFLDRANSLLFASPAVFHFVGYFNGFGLDQPTRILTGG
jgi:phosphatidate cytidylyltransferase